MLSVEELFLRDVGALKRAMDSPSFDNLFDATLPLRKLLIDPHPLLHKANTAKVKIEFEVADRRPLWEIMPPGLSFAGDFHAVGPVPSGQRSKSVKLPQFLATKIAIINGSTVTVHDLIDYVAHYAGVVHKNDPNTSLTKAIDELASTMPIPIDSSILMHAMRPICSAVFHAALPIYNQIENARSQGQLGRNE